MMKDRAHVFITRNTCVHPLLKIDSYRSCCYSVDGVSRWLDTCSDTINANIIVSLMLIFANYYVIIAFG